MTNFGLDTKVSGMPINEYLASMIEKNDNQEIEIERGLLTISALKQMNNHSRICLDAAKYELKKMEYTTRTRHK